LHCDFAAKPFWRGDSHLHRGCFASTKLTKAVEQLLADELEIGKAAPRLYRRDRGL
jgi:hypothetical protein